MKPEFTPAERTVPPFFDTLQLYRARIYDKPDAGDDRLQVRIIPHMADIEETDLLPYWPPFFKGQVFVGNTEKENKKTADYVWVAAVPDFTLGYIMGYANNFESPAASSKFSDSYNYKDLLQGLIRRGLVPAQTTYKNLHIQFWTENFLEMINIKTGDKFTILSNGTILAVHRNQIYMRVGADNGPFSAMRMSKDDISFTTNHFRVKANTVSLGDKGLYVVATASGTPASVEGATFSPQSTILV